MCGLTQEERKRYFNLCDPGAPLQRDDDARYVPLDGEGDGPQLVRGAEWVDEIASVLELSNRPVCALFTGLPGTGKTTTLHRLIHRLEGGPDRFFCVYIDVETRLDIHTPIDVPDVLITVALELEASVLRAESRDLKDALRDGYLARLWEWLKRIDPEFERFETGARLEGTQHDPSAPDGPHVLTRLKHAPPLRELLRRRIAEHMSTFLADVRDEIARLHRRVMQVPLPKGSGWVGVVVIVDSLEKLRGTHSNFEDVLASAERVFADGAESLRLVSAEETETPLVHVVYTIPAALAARQTMYGLKYLPMIKLRNERGVEHGPGMAVARRLVRARIPDEVLARLFSGGSGAMEAAVRRIILWSGGYPREIIRMLQVLVTETRPSDETRIESLLQRQGDAYRRIVPSVAFPWLARVAVDHELTIIDDSQRPVVDQMLANNVVLRYQNAREWFDVHPALFDLDEFRQHVVALRAARASATVHVEST